MDFVPDGYYDREEDELDGEFDFGDGYIPGQFEGDPIVVSGIKEGKSAPDGPLTTSCSAGDEDDEELIVKTPVKGGKGSLCSSDASMTNSSRQESKDNSTNSPVTFKISNSPQESFDDDDGGIGPSSGNVAKPLTTLAQSRSSGGSCDQGVPRSSGQLKFLERGEDLKVAVVRGNVEHVAKILDGGTTEGRYILA